MDDVRKERVPDSLVANHRRWHHQDLLLHAGAVHHRREPLHQGMRRDYAVPSHDERTQVGVLRRHTDLPRLGHPVHLHAWPDRHLLFQRLQGLVLGRILYLPARHREAGRPAGRRTAQRHVPVRKGTGRSAGAHLLRRPHRHQRSGCPGRNRRRAEGLRRLAGRLVRHSHHAFQAGVSLGGLPGQDARVEDRQGSAGRADVPGTPLPPSP